MKGIIFIGFILANVFTSTCQEISVTPFPMLKSSLLWEISGPDTQPSYLFGTMHLIEKENFFFPKKLQKAVKRSEVLVMELAGIPEEVEAMKYLILNEGSFFDFFSPMQTDTILLWAKEKFHIDESTFRKTFNAMKPFAVVQLSIQLHFIGKTESYELTLEQLAQESGIKIEGLETIEEQMGLFDQLTKKQQAEMVMESVRESDRSIEIIEEMQNIYSRHEIDSLYLFVSQGGGIIETEQNQFLDERNKKWIPKIVSLIANRKTFIAVGAGHLGGPNGVIRLLEKEGYTLTPIQL